MKRVVTLLAFFLFLSSQQFLHAQAGEWTWMSGSNTMNGTENYGTQGVPSTANHPQALYEACEWTDTSGMFWLYGGSALNFDAANLWRFNPTTYEWTWMNGPGNGYTVATYGTLGVADPANTPGSRGFGTTTFTGKDNNLYLFGGLAFGSHNDLWKYDISINEWTWIKGPSSLNDPGSYGTQGIPSATNLPASRSECAASWVDSTGNLWLFGGWIGQGYNDLWRYDPVTNEWTWMKGSSIAGAAAVYGTKGVANSTNTPGGRNSYGKWNDGHNLYLFGGDAFVFSEQYNDVWKYIVSTNEWVWISGTNQANAAANVTSQCVADVDFYPAGRREGRACWVDPCKKFWLYGGSSQGSFWGSQNDLWKFDPVSLEWTWVNGSLNTMQTGSFGTQGVSSSSNQPPSRSGDNAWADKQGNLWLFGGCDFTWPSAWNDLWRFIPDSLCSGTCNINNNPSQVNFSASDTNVCEKFCINFFDFSVNNPTSWQWLFPGGSPSSSTLQNPTNICYQNPGVFDVTLITTNANGNDTLTLSNYITVNATPAFPTITQVGYTLTSSNSSSYQWQFNAVNIPGATNQSYTVMQSGYYTVIVSNENGCVNSTTVYVLISGVDDVSDESGISIYPNPSSGNFIVELPNGSTADEVSIDVINALGQRIFSSTEKTSFASFKKEIDLCNGTACDIPSGVYFIEIKTQIILHKEKIIIMR